MIKEFIQQMPKAELLIHLEGSLEPELMFKLAARNNISLPYANIEEARKAHQFGNINAFLTLYYDSLKVLVTEEDFYELTWAYLEKAVAQNIRHTEISIDPQAHIARGISLDTFMPGIHRALKDGTEKLDISSALILCIMRDLSEEDAQKLLLKALEFNEWIIAIGLDSTEMNNPPEKFKEVFRRAREYGFLTVASAGEEGPAEYVWQAIDTLQVSRVGYGLHIVDDIDLMARLAMKQIPVSVCPVSNVKLGFVKTMQKHPLKRMLQEGLCVTVNSDDPAYFHAYLNENFEAAQTAFSFHKDEIIEMARNSFIASFLEHEKRDQFLKELDEFQKKWKTTEA